MAAAVCLPCSVLAQSVQQTLPQTAAEPAPAAVATKDASDTQPLKLAPVQSVEIKGRNNYDARRDDTASKTVLNTDEIRKYGDDNIYDVLKRAPGVTVTGKTLRMRGLGAGYTQILVNGDRPPPGFSLDALTPDQIERIEIVRAASAEFSMQAIAGTINIVLRHVVTKPQHDARLNVMHSPFMRGLDAGGTWGERIGSISYFLNGTFYAGHNESDSNGSDAFILPDGTLSQARLTHGHGGGSYHGLVLNPRINWKIDDMNELNFSAGLQATHSNWAGRSQNDNRVGSWPAPDWIDVPYASETDQALLRGEVNWIAKLGGGKLDLTASADGSRNDNDSLNDYYTAGHGQHLVRDWDTVSHAHRASLRGKFTRSLFDGHALATGFDTSRQGNDDVRDRHEQQDGAAPVHIVEGFEPQITRLAAFVQDEWNVTKQWSMYLGGRWEGVRTDSAATGLPETHSNSHVLSPVAQTLYKFPDNSGQQLRLALTRTYKAPTIDQLTARRYESVLNTRFDPDSGGNPALRPELANGIDAAYEHYWPQGAMVSLSGSRRMISDYIRTRLDEDPDGRWVYRPLNDGSARVHTLEAEVKLPGRTLGDAWAHVDMRASVSRNWSTVSTVPGPDNRLDGQTPMSATLGVDWRRDRLSLGASMAYQQGGWVRVSEEQSRLQQTRRDLDAYALWKLDARFQLRLSLNNILGMDQASKTTYADASGLSRETSFTRGAMRTGLNLEMKL
jgi:outer membrane receptor for ferrienterochelin and colicins